MEGLKIQTILGWQTWGTLVFGQWFLMVFGCFNVELFIICCRKKDYHMTSWQFTVGNLRLVSKETTTNYSHPVTERQRWGSCSRAVFPVLRSQCSKSCGQGLYARERKIIQAGCRMVATTVKQLQRPTSCGSLQAHFFYVEMDLFLIFKGVTIFEQHFHDTVDRCW